MRVFVIGATGYVGSHVAEHLARRGHQVVGFARDTAAAKKVRAAGLGVHIGEVSDVDDLVAAARRADAVVFAPQLMVDEEHAVVAALLDGYGGSGKTFVFTSGTGVLAQRTGGDWSEDAFAEDDAFQPVRAIARRVDTENLVRGSVAIGVRGFVIRPPMIWGGGRYTVVDLIADSVRKTGSACYVGLGLNLYSNVHIDDLSDLFCAVVERGAPGALYHAVSGELNYRCAAELVARRLDCKAMSVTMDEAIDIWGKFAALIIMGVCSRARSPRARAELGWIPTRLGLIDAILEGAFSSLSI